VLGFADRGGHGAGKIDGETYDELGARVVAGLVRIAARHDGDHVLAVTHGGPIRSALAAAERVPFEEARRSIHVVGNCAVVRFAIREGSLERVD
jgi:broad specificity phosphatase PhoE